MCTCLALCSSYLNQRSDILVFNRSLALDFVKSSSVRTVSHTLILKIALTTLVADRAVERVVGEEELHDTFASFVDEWGVGLDPHSGLYRPGAGGDGLWGSFDFDQTHTTVSSNHELLVVAISWNDSSSLFACLNKGRSG